MTRFVATQTLDAAINVTDAQLTALAHSSCRDTESECAFLRRVSDKQRAALTGSDKQFDALLDQCGLRGWTWIDTVTIAVSAAVFVCVVAMCVAVALRRSRRSQHRGEYERVPDEEP